MSNNQLAATPQAFNRKSAPTTQCQQDKETAALGPLATLAQGNTWLGETGYNLMVVPSPLSTNGFIVMLSQLFETHIFDAVPAPVPNRTRDNGTEQMGAVKYSQTVAENVTKNILHEETGMWLNQTLGTIPPGCPPLDPATVQAGLGPLTGDLATLAQQNSISRSGVVPHGNTFQATGSYNPYAFPTIPPTLDLTKYLAITNFQTTTDKSQLSFLPVYADASDPTDLQTAYKAEVEKAIALIQPNGGPLQYENFVNPIGFLNAYANNIGDIDALAVTSTIPDGGGGVFNLPLETKVAGPQSFTTTFLIETIYDESANGPTDDQNPSYHQLQYLTSIPLLFPNGFNGKPVIFPHWNVNTLLAV